MSKIGIALLGVLALLAVTGLTPSTATASGPVWHVGGHTPGQGKIRQLKLQAKTTSILESTVSGVPIEVVCNTSISEGATIESQGESRQGQGKGRIRYSSCTVIQPAGCTIAQPIITNQLKTYLAYNPNSTQQKDVDVFEPTSGEIIVTLHFSNCGIIEFWPVDGAIAAEVVPVGRENQEDLLNFPNVPITNIVHEQQAKTLKLNVGGEDFKIKTSYGARLATNEIWGVF